MDTGKSEPRTSEEPTVEPAGPDVLSVIDPRHRSRFSDIAEAIDLVCDEHLAPLAEEYRATCLLLAATCCQDGTPVVEGRAKPESWAAGILWTIGSINFLNDPSFPPNMTLKEVAAAFRVSAATVEAKARDLRDGLDIRQFDPRWTLPTLAERNPMMWIVENAAGRVVDVRTLPVAAQEALAEAGMIPFAYDEVFDEQESIESMMGGASDLFGYADSEGFDG